MSESSEAAEQMVKMSLDGVDVGLRLTGKAAKEIAVLIYTVITSKEQTSGKAKLKNMIKSGKPLTVFSIKKEDLEQFQKEAKTYGILYSALIDKNNKDMDGMVDIVVRKEDAPRINRIVERFKLASFNKADIVSDIEKCADRILVIKDGQKVFDGTEQETGKDLESFYLDIFGGEE